MEFKKLGKLEKKDRRLRMAKESIALYICKNQPFMVGEGLVKSKNKNFSNGILFHFFFFVYTSWKLPWGYQIWR